MPGIDPSIPLRAGRGVVQMNPLQTLTQAAQLRYMNSNANALQQQINSNIATSRGYQAATDPVTGQVDNNKLISILSQDPNAAYNLGAVIQGINAQKIQNQTLNTSKQALAAKRWEALGKESAGFLTNPNATGADYVSGITNLVNQGVIDAPTAVQELKRVSPYLGDPAKLKEMVRQSLAGLPAEIQQRYVLPALSTVNTGGKTNVLATNPITGAPAVTGTMTNTMTPGEAATPVPYFDTKTNTPSIMTKGQFAGGGVPGTSVQDGTQPSGSIPAGPSLGVQAAANVAGEDSAKQLGADRAQAGSSNQRIYQLQTALHGLENSPTGPGTDTTHQIASFFLSQTPADLGKYLPGVNVNEIKSYDEANKYLTQYAMARAGSMGQGTDQKLAAAFTGNASTHISNLAAQDVVKANIGLERMEQAKINAFDNSGLSPDQYGKWSAQWAKHVDPRAFISDQLSGPQFTAMWKSMSPKDQASFRAQYNAAVANKLISGVQ